jgi:hypothetical protein
VTQPIPMPPNYQPTRAEFDDAIKGTIAEMKWAAEKEVGKRDKRIAELEAEVAGFRAAIDRAGMVFINHPDPAQFQIAFKPEHPAISKIET